MSESRGRGERTVRGRLRRRLLVNAVVDPAEAERRLPVGIRPHVADGGTVVGCCLLEIDAVRPAGIPAVAGRRLRAVAHRISVEWDDASGATEVGVYVPVRHTDSPLAAVLGGRWLPGVHHKASLDVERSAHVLRWQSEPRDDAGRAIRVEVSMPRVEATAPIGDVIGQTCLSAATGLSPDRRGRLEAARMLLSHRAAQAVAVEDLVSPFLHSFASATLATSYLMCDAEVTWTPAPAPNVAGTLIPR